MFASRVGAYNKYAKGACIYRLCFMYLSVTRIYADRTLTLSLILHLESIRE